MSLNIRELLFCEDFWVFYVLRSIKIKMAATVRAATTHEGNFPLVKAASDTSCGWKLVNDLFFFPPEEIEQQIEQLQAQRSSNLPKTDVGEKVSLV